MTDQLSIARELLRQLLSVGPQKGARLKALLAREFERQTRTAFHQAFWNFPKFSAFLAANADMLDVVVPGGPGDITVSLRQAGAPDRSAAPIRAPLSQGRFIPSPVWSAFANPDPRRRRFFHRASGEIAHFIEGSQEAPNPKIAVEVAGDPNYVEITPVSADQQGAWVKEFLASVPVPESKRAFLSTLATTPYSSAVNTAFMATLGDHAEPWRQFRAARIHQAVRSWADRHGVPFDQIIGPAVPTNHLDLGARPDLAPPVFQASASVHELRRWLHTVIDTLDPADISQILLPAGSLFKLTTRRG